MHHSVDMPYFESLACLFMRKGIFSALRNFRFRSIILRALPIKHHSFLTSSTKVTIMGKLNDSIQPHHKEFIEKQHIFFVATAPLSAHGRINLSPKGLDCFRVLSENRVAYMDLISSGNETSAHTLENGRITIMFCSFEGNPNILRLYGKGFTVLRGTDEWKEYSSHFKIYPSTRQIIVADIDLVQTSCGFGVPLFDYAGERDKHFEWAEKKGEEGLKTYVREKNLVSLDGLPTDLGTRSEA